MKRAVYAVFILVTVLPAVSSAGKGDDKSAEKKSEDARSSKETADKNQSDDSSSKTESESPTTCRLKMQKVTQPDKGTYTQYKYENGNLVKKITDDGMDKDSEPNSVRTYSYDDEGNLVRQEDDTSGLDEVPDGKTDWVTEFTYDAEGNRTKKLTDSDVDGETDLVWRYEYNEKGQRTVARYNSNLDGSADKILRYEYEDGRLVKKLQDGYLPDEKPDGEANIVHEYGYDEDGRIKSHRETGPSGKPVVKKYFHDENGALKKRTYDGGWKEAADGDPDKIRRYEYTDSSKTVRIEFDNGKEKVKRFDCTDGATPWERAVQSDLYEWLPDNIN